VAQAQQQIDRHQFREWIAFFELEPYGDEWRQTATIAALALAPWSKKPIRPDDILDDAFPQRRRRQTPQQIERIFLAFGAQLEARQKNH
jgi:hypothetical protein